MSEAASAAEASALLAALHAEDRTEHVAVPLVGTSEYRSLRERDRQRRLRAERALELLQRERRIAAEDVYHAAWLFNHGDNSAEAKKAHELALEAAELGHPKARWLAAASYDRWCMYEGRPQRYGTQFVPDGTRYRLWDVDPSTTDAERAKWDVPPLSQQLLRAKEITVREPQPPMNEAPKWLKPAIERWNSGGSESAPGGAG
jgi:hypothetical protein